MKNFSLLFLALLLPCLPSRAQEKTITAETPQVDTRQYTDDQGRKVNETITTTKVREVSENPKSFKAAIFIANRAGEQFDSNIMPLEDFLTSRVADRGFEIISREIAADSLRAFDPATASSKRPTDSLEARLTDQSSALRLAQNLGADYLLVASLTSVGSRERAVNAYGVAMVTNETTLRISYKILDGATGSTITADTITSKDSTRQTENAVEKNSDLLNGLLDDAAQQLASSLESKVLANKIRAVDTKVALASLNIQVEVADVTIPDVRLSPDNIVSIHEGKAHASPVNATVEIDGVAVGTVPGIIQVRTGFSKLRVSREGFRTWERTINAVNGQTLTVALQMTDEALARWMASTAFLNGLKNGAKLTDAQAEVLKGQAKALSESYMKIKVDTTDGLSFTNKSIF